MIGIYCIENIVNGKKYFGQSINLKRRIGEHKSDLKLKTHRNPILQRSWDKYGKECFDFYIVELCAEDELDDRERWYISEHKTSSEKFGYNLDSGGNKYKQWSEEAKVRFRKLVQLKVKNAFDGIAPYHIVGNTYRRGQKQSEEAKRKMSISKLGKKRPDGFGEMRSAAMMGNKIGLGNKSNSGRKFSDDHIKKVVESRRKNRERKLLELSEI